MLAECPHALLATSGRAVGLPAGQMGNSEVGHMNIGSGRIVAQDLPRIDVAIEDGTLATRPALLALMQWGDRWAWQGRSGPVGVSHEHCGHEIHIEIRCAHCDAPVKPDQLRAQLRRPSAGDAGAKTPAPDQPGYISARRLLASPNGIALNA